MGHVAAAGEHGHLDRANYLRADELGECHRAVLVLIAVDHQHRRAHARQIVAQAPAVEGRREPGFGPTREHPRGALAVPAREPCELRRSGESVSGATDPFTSALLDKCLRRLAHHRETRLPPRRGDQQRHAAAHAVAEEHILTEPECLPERRQVKLGLVADETRRDRLVAGRRSPEPQAVVCDHASPKPCRELLRKVPPQLDASERIVKQHERRLASVVERSPRAHEYSSARYVHELVARLDALHALHLPRHRRKLTYRWVYRRGGCGPLSSAPPRTSRSRADHAR